MYADKRILVVVPARGGSKGIPLKNLYPVGGRPLVARVGDLVRQLRWVDRSVVSTDHADIAKVARAAGLDAPFYRPPELSGDRVSDLEVLTQALRETERIDGTTYDVVVMLQPTSPLRRVEHVDETVRKLLDENLDAVWTVSRTDPKYHPLKQLTLDNGRLGFWDAAGAGVIARQQLGEVFHRNGAAYAFTRDCLLEQASILGARSGAVVIEEPMVSIDTLQDIGKVESLLDRLPTEPASRLPGTLSSIDCISAERTFVVDIDGVIATLVPDNDYRKAEPMHENIRAINALYKAGHRVVLFTARGSATGKNWDALTQAQLAEWGVRYHELRFGKPAADYYIDDRLIALHDALQLTGIGTE